MPLIPQKQDSKVWMPKIDQNGEVRSTSNPLDISQNQKAVSSEYSYGSFSGTDIQVYAHYHTNSVNAKVLRSRSDVLTDELLSIYADMETLLNGSNVVPNANNIVSRFRDLEEQKAYLEKEIRKIDLEIAKSTSNLVRPLGTVSTIAYSIFREKAPSRALGRVYPKLYTRGPRTIGGTIVFTVINKHVFHELMELNLGSYNTGTSDNDRFKTTTALPDQLPPIDLSLVFNNEYGATSYMGLYGVEFMQEGTTFSVEDIYSENVMQYVARDIDLLRPIGQRNLDPNATNEWSETASDLSGTYNKLNVRQRRNPFV